MVGTSGSEPGATDFYASILARDPTGLIATARLIRGSPGADYIAFLFVDRIGTLWVAHAHGIDRFDPVTQGFRHYRPLEIDEPEFHYAAEDLEGALWLARTGDGLDRFDPNTGRFTHYVDDPADKHSISLSFAGSAAV